MPVLVSDGSTTVIEEAGLEKRGESGSCMRSQCCAWRRWKCFDRAGRRYEWVFE